MSDSVQGRRREVLAKLANVLPPGSRAVGSGLIITGLTAYAYLVLTARVLGPWRYVPLSVLWAAVFVIGPGLFLPLQQEITRISAHRVLEKVGAGSVLRRAALSGLAVAVVVLAALGAAIGPIDQHLFEGEGLLGLGLGLSLVGYLLLSLLWGSLAGSGRFGDYAAAQSGDGLLRIAVCALLAIVGVRSAGPYGLVLGVTPIAAALAVGARNRDLLAPGPPTAWNDLSAALGWLLMGSFGAQLLANAPVIAVKLLAVPRQQEMVGHFLAGLVISRVPLFLFGAVQASLLPRLALLARAGRHQEFQSGLLRLLALVAGIAVGATVASWAVGPWVVHIVFGAKFTMGRMDLTLLAAASGTYMLVLVMVQPLVALGLHARSAVGWIVGIVVFGLVSTTPTSLLLRVELAFLCGTLAALCTSAALLWTKLPGIAGSIDADSLQVAASSLELEP